VTAPFETRRGDAWIDRLLRRSPAQPLFRWRAARRLVVLAYHDVRDGDLFRAQMEHLARVARVVSADDVCCALRGEIELAPRSVLVTFDDGDRSVYQAGVPILQGLGLPAVVFIVAGLLDTDTPFWWVEAEALVGRVRPSNGHRGSPAEAVREMKRLPDAERREALAALRRAAAPEEIRTPQLRSEELRAMHASGIEIGNHTWSHPCLDRCDDAGVAEEVVRAHDALREVLGRAPRLFAYPNGNRDARVPPLLRELGYDACFLFDHRIGRFPPGDPYAVSRVRVNSTTSMDRFRIILSGLHPFVHRARGLS
jgi:peptidoglycan/xylan/chitin deacetylase (PgdA/CDA1 family)